MRSLLFDDGQYLILEVGLAHVEERLPGHRGVLNPLLVGQEREYRLHERAFASGGRRLHDHRKRRIQMPRDDAQIADELVRLLAHHAAPREVLDDAVEQLRIAQQLQCCRPILRADLNLFILRLQSLFDLLVL